MATIKELRKFLGITQKELSEKAGMNIRLLQKYESGYCDEKNMTSKNAAAIEKAFGCALTEIKSLNLGIFTESTKNAIKSGDMDLSDLLAMDKYRKVQKISMIGNMESTFSANFRRIPDGLFAKLSTDEVASLVDAFYKCYSDGKCDR